MMAITGMDDRDQTESVIAIHRNAQIMAAIAMKPG
jgi:hypothetical protein